MYINTPLYVYKLTREERLIAFPPLHYGGGEQVVLGHTDLTSHRTLQLLAEQEFLYNNFYVTIIFICINHPCMHVVYFMNSETPYELH